MHLLADTIAVVVGEIVAVDDEERLFETVGGERSWMRRLGSIGGAANGLDLRKRRVAREGLPSLLCCRQTETW